jgi:hypothetical protein
MQSVFSGLVVIGAMVGIAVGFLPASSPAGNGLAALALGSGLWVLFQSGVLDDFEGAAVFSSRGRRKDHWWDDSLAPTGWSDLLTARDQAGAHYARQFIRGPEWARKTLEIGLLALSILLNVDLFLLLGDTTLIHAADTVMRIAGPAMIIWVLVWVVWAVGANRRHDRRRLRIEDDETADEIAILRALGGWGAIGRRFNACCFGAEPSLPSFRRGLLLAVPFASGVLRLLWPHRHEAALMAMLGIILAHFNYQAYQYYRMRRQAIHPENVSPCRSLPLRQFIRTTAEIRDRGGRLAIDLQRALESDSIDGRPANPGGRRSCGDQRAGLGDEHRSN